jgi:hypothetical protein
VIGGQPTRDEELEAEIWRAMKLHRVTTPHALVFMMHLLHLARAYAAGDGPGLTRERRYLLELNTAPGLAAEAGKLYPTEEQ